MPRLRVYTNFLDKRNEVKSTRDRARIDKMLRTIEQMPGVGSALVAASLRDRYGPSVLKALVSPYLIVYEYDQTNDIVYVYDLITGRSVR